MSPSLPPGVNSFGLWGSCGKASYKFHKRVFLQLSSVSCARVCSPVPNALPAHCRFRSFLVGQFPSRGTRQSGHAAPAPGPVP